ncbi:MAG: DUF11 domain-containing protein [Deltaproteobacteria bacterium]|nr:MAG: DUF11 domain-containing protein [Deltaproteobacteria bacterium]
MGTMLRGFGRAFVLGALLAASLWGSLPGTVATAAVIPNTAHLDYDVGGVSQPTMPSNTVTLISRTPAVIEFLKYAPRAESGGEAVHVPATSYDQGGGSFNPIPQPAPTLNPTVPLLGSPRYYLGETIYLRLTDADQNTNPGAPDTVVITVSCAETGDSEVLRLTETGNDTGVFAGYLPTTLAAAPGADGVMVVRDECNLQASYTDPADLVKTVTDAALVDPYGIVFDSASGQPVDGATVTLFDVVANAPATVFADDGISPYPATITSGDPAYGLPPGGFRFPYILPGTYRLDVTPPAGYTFPTSATDAQLLVVRPGAALTLGSRHEPFPVLPGPALRIDIPVDPLASYLWLQKSVDDDEASVGDFLQYRLQLENTSAGVTAPATTISDRLPLGFRYQKGSARIAGKRADDPAISADGRTLTFRLGDLPPKSSVTVTYVVEVAAGAKPGEATNTARAGDSSGAASNQARATVTVREAFFRNKAILVGRVLTGGCSDDDTAMKGLPGVRLYLEDGSFVVTGKDGKYHFEGLEPGTHVVQVDLATLPAGFEMIPCEESSQSAGRSFSRFVDLRGGTLWQVNFHAAPLPPPTGEVTLQLRSSLEGETATLRAVATAASVPVDNLRLTMMLPGKSEYLPGSARQNGEAVADPPAIGGAVTLRLPRLEPGRPAEFIIGARLAGGQTDGELPAKALLTFDSPAAKNQRTPVAENRFRLAPGSSRPSEEIRLYPRFPSFVAELQETDRAMLEQLVARLSNEKLIRIDIVGHTDSQEIAPPGRKIFADNQALSEGRARSVAAFLRERLPAAAAILSERGLGETLPVADNATEEGRALNRRVEVYLVTAPVSHPARVEITEPTSPVQSLATTGASATAVVKAARVEAPAAAEPPEMTSTWMAALKPETAIVWPAPGTAPEISATRVVVQHPRGSVVDLRVNGESVAAFHFDTAKPVPNSTFMVSNWEGLDLRAGLNRIEATVATNDGQPPVRLERELWYVTDAEKVEWFEDKSTLYADGIHPPTFALRLTDRDGHPLHPGQQVEYRVSTPYQALRDGRYEDTARAAGIGRLAVGADGLAYIQLEPTVQVGEVTLTLTVPGEPLEIRAWLKPAPRDWILVGFAEGTTGYNTISDKMVTVREAGLDEHGYTDGRVKFFAKGAIKGEWLLTLAYDSDKPDLDGDSLHQVIDPDTYYPLYGDDTRQGYEAASARDIYVKLERNQFYALFGDMQTGLSRTELAKYVRSLNGFKSELQSEVFDYTVFVADTRQGFVKDELRGDGTSGRYALSQKKLVINSEQVVIETRGRFHNEVILKTETLSRHVDYDIDYNAGTLYFKRPVPSKDAELNPVFIVVRYETRSADKTRLNYGGRAAVKLLDRKVEVGATHVHEENGAGKGNLYGADVTVKLAPKTVLRAEVATTEVESIDRQQRKGDAWLAEVVHTGEQAGVRAYAREQEGTFGLGQQNGGESGTRTYGVDGSYRFTPHWSAAGEAYRQENLETEATRDVGQMELRYRDQGFGLMAGVREARDRFDNGETERSRQLIAGGDLTLFNRLTVRATHEQSLGGSDENADFPTRTLLGADLKVTASLSLFAEQEFTWGDKEDTEGTRLGFKSTPWTGGTLTSAVEREMTENGERVFALFGLGQSWQVTRHWSVDLSLDRSYTIRHPGNDRLNVNVPQASGSDEDFTAVSAGASYRAETWSWSNRVETRQSDNEDKIGVSSALVGDLREGVAASARVMALITDAGDGSSSEDEEVSFGLAWRPNQSRWIVLERLDLERDSRNAGEDDSESWRIVNHLHASYRPNRQWQTSVYYGLKYVCDSFDGDRYDGVTDMFALETRYNLGKRWDIGVNGAALHSWNSSQLDYSAGASVGFQVLTNSWLSAGYNLTGFEDDDFSAANYTASGPYVKFRVKFDQQTAREAVEWFKK